MPEERSGFLHLHLFLDTVTMGLKLRGGTLTPCGRLRVLSPSPHPIPTSAKVFFKVPRPAARWYPISRALSPTV